MAVKISKLEQWVSNAGTTFGNAIATSAGKLADKYVIGAKKKNQAIVQSLASAFQQDILDDMRASLLAFATDFMDDDSTETDVADYADSLREELGNVIQDWAKSLLTDGQTRPASEHQNELAEKVRNVFIGQLEGCVDDD